MNALDRTVVGNHSQAADTASTVLLTTQTVLPYAFGLFDLLITKPSDGWIGELKDSLVLFETVAVNNCVNGLVKLAVNRPRPFVYDTRLSDAERIQPDAARSFYSAHTSTSFAMATAYSHLFTQRHPDSPLVVPIWIGTHELAAVTGILRVEAGKHFWTDVLVGAVVGSGIGLLVPYLHTRKTEEDRKKGEERGKLSIVPLAYAEGIGLMLSWH